MSYPKIKSARAIDSHTLLVEFDNLESKRYDVTPLLGKEMFAPLQNPAFFKNVQVDNSGHAVYWNEDIDLSEYELWSKGASLRLGQPAKPILAIPVKKNQTMLKFTKMHGLGNDFVVIDAVRQVVDLTPGQIRHIADRHVGVGCDQLLLVEPPVSPDADFRYRIFNADGSEVGQCGNGARCFARFVHEQGLSDKREVRVDTKNGRLLLRRDEDGNITVDMGAPRHDPAQIPLQADQEASSYTVSVKGESWSFGAVSMGNPHAVLLVDNVDDAPVLSLGPALECHALFPERVNVGFMQILDPHHIRLRVYERGSGETLACGSGACGAVVVGMEQGLLKSPVQVNLPGGSLSISWLGRGEAVFMTGPAVTVFVGMIEL